MTTACCLLAALFCHGIQETPPTTIPLAAPRTVFVLRHAEKATDDPKDPALTETGHARARRLAGLLAAAGVSRVHATKWMRTRQTVEPLAAALDLEIIPYEATGYEALATSLRGLEPGGTAVVCGHSNTVPGIVEALSGRRIEVPDDAYDRLFIVVLPAQGPSKVLELRF